MSRHQQKSIPGRNLRLADQIQQDLAVLIQREVPMSRAGLITLTGVDLSPDYAHAKVYFTVMGAEPEVAESVLNDKAGWFHSQLFKLLHIHTVPRLHFLHDTQMAHGFEMNELIDRANRRNAQEGNGSNEPDDPDETRG